MSISTVADALRLADELGIPDLRKRWVETSAARWKGERPPACAIGGANIAARVVSISPGADGRVPSAQAQKVSSPVLFGDDIWRHESCPERLCFRANLFDVVVHLYEGHKWNRTRIAAWLDLLAVPA